MKQWNLHKKQANERQQNTAKAKASKAKMSRTRSAYSQYPPGVAFSEQTMALYDFAQEAHKATLAAQQQMQQQMNQAMQQVQQQYAQTQLSPANITDIWKLQSQPWQINGTMGTGLSPTYYPLNPQGGGSINPAPAKPGGPAMANKFKEGDIVILTKAFDGAEAGAKARVKGWSPGHQAYHCDFSEFQPGWNPDVYIPVNCLGIVTLPDKKKIKVTFDSVIIADHKRQEILEALEQIHQQELIFEKWGFGGTIEKGRGISLLFYGPPGTGKTLMAQAIANKLDYKLKIISTADIESSAPGQAERNIRKHFQDASAEGSEKSILLFDECDSLVYTRQSVGPILGAQINELLSNIEKFEGITIFTTNRLGTLDEALNRRLALKLEFDLPTREERVEIWKRMFPKKAPLDDDVDWWKLAVIEVSGGYIKNAVLRAARMAAAEKKPDKQKRISMAHLIKAAKLETEAMIKFEEARAEHNGGIGHRDGYHVTRTRGGDYDQS